MAMCNDLLYMHTISLGGVAGMCPRKRDAIIVHAYDKSWERCRLVFRKRGTQHVCGCCLGDRQTLRNI